jgi:fatty-acyl-CoA synthase
MLHEYLRTEGKGLEHMERVIIGGAAVPRSMIQAFEDEFGVEARQGWGMTEMSPVGTMGRLKGSQRDLDRETQLDFKTCQGRSLFGVEMKIVDEAGKRLPRDGKSAGELRVRGPWVMGGYYANEEATKAAMDEEGWLRTGDVATHDEEGYVRLVDRTRDMIKSGGEWISSIEIENAAVGHADVAEAGVIGLPHAKWGERPLLVIVAKEGATPDKDAILAYLAERLISMAVPDDVAVVAELPHTATGKIRKTQLRDDFKDYKLPGA